MSAVVIVLSLGLFAAIVGVAYWFAGEEQKKMSPEPELDEHTRQARRESAASITNIPIP